MDIYTDHIDSQRRRGRGAAVNPTGRFERLVSEAADDGWDIVEDLPPIRTEVAIDASRTVLTRNQSPDVPFDRSINPYRGCEHGCVYCYARPTHAQLGLSPGLDFETRLVAKPDAPRLLEQALRKPGYRVAPIAIGTNTDPYQPIEKDMGVMRGVLEVLCDYRHPVMITTKGSLVTRDIDVLGPMAEDGLAHVQVSLTTLDGKLCRAMEPRAAAPARRLEMIRALARAGVPVGVNVAPIVPALTEHEIENLVEAAALAGASHGGYITLRLPLEVNPLFRDWLARRYPDRAKRVLAKVREMHGGRDYNATFGKRMKGEGVHARLIAKRFEAACRHFGLKTEGRNLRSDLFRRRHGWGISSLSGSEIWLTKDCDDCHSRALGPTYVVIHDVNPRGDWRVFDDAEIDRIGARAPRATKLGCRSGGGRFLRLPVP